MLADGIVMQDSPLSGRTRAPRVGQFTEHLAGSVKHGFVEARGRVPRREQLASRFEVVTWNACGGWVCLTKAVCYQYTWLGAIV